MRIIVKIDHFIYTQRTGEPLQTILKYRRDVISICPEKSWRLMLHPTIGGSLILTIQYHVNTDHISYLCDLIKLSVKNHRPSTRDLELEEFLNLYSCIM